MNTVEYKGTFYSEPELPAFTGLLNDILELKYNCQGNNRNMSFDIDAWLVCTELNGDSRFEVLKSQSKYEITLNSPFTVDELYTLVCNATENLKAFKQADENMKIQLQRVPLPTIESIRATLERVVTNCRENHT